MALGVLNTLKVLKISDYKDYIFARTPKRINNPEIYEGLTDDSVNSLWTSCHL